MDRTSFPPAFNAVLSHSLLTYKEECALAIKARRGDEVAIGELVRHNTRLVYNMASRFSFRPEDVHDFFSAGIEGLVAAASRFDPKKSVQTKARFATFASWYIRQRMQLQARALHGGNTSLPAGAARLLTKVRAFQSSYREEHAVEPTADQIAEGIGAKVIKVVCLLAVTTPQSLDAPVGNDDGSASFHDFVDSEMRDPAELADDADGQSALQREVDALPPSHRDVLSRRFGLNGRDKETLEEIGQSHRVTRERVRQIEAEALKILRGRIGRKQSEILELAA